MSGTSAPALTPTAQSVTQSAPAVAASAAAAPPANTQPLSELFDAAFKADAKNSPVAAHAAAPAAVATTEPAKTPSLFGAKKTADPVATATPEPVIELPEDLPAETPEPTKVNWKKARELQRKLGAELTAKTKETEDLKHQIEVHRKAAPADLAEVERLKTEHKTLSDRLAVLDLQNHPDFARQYVAPKQQAIAAAKEVLDYNSKGDVNLEGLLSLPLKEFNAKVAEVTKDMNSMDSTTVQTSLRSAYTTNQAGRAALSKAGELAQQLVQKDASVGKHAFEQIWTELESGTQVLQPVELPADLTAEERTLFEARNAAVLNLRANAERNVFGNMSTADVAKMGTKAALSDFFLGHEVPRIVAAYNHMHAQYQSVLAENAAMKKSRSPGSVTGDMPAAVTKPNATGSSGKPQALEDLFTGAYGR